MRVQFALDLLWSLVLFLFRFIVDLDPAVSWIGDNHSSEPLAVKEKQEMDQSEIVATNATNATTVANDRYSISRTWISQELSSRAPSTMQPGTNSASSISGIKNFIVSIWQTALNP